MKPSEEQFDDFKEPETAAYVNDAIGRVFEKELTEVEQFKEDLDDQLLMADNPQDELTEMIIGYIQGAGDVNQVNICSYRAKNGVGIDAWGFSGDEDLTTVDLFLTLYVNPDESSKISANDLDRHFNWLNRFYDQSKAGTIFSRISEDKSDLYQVAQLINQTSNIDRIRLFLLTNAIMPSSYDKPNTELESGTSCEFYVWDAKRVMQQDHIISGKSPIVVDFESDYNCTLPCIKMPDVSDKVSCYLCIKPNDVDEKTKNYISEFNHKKLMLPRRFYPDKNLLAQHFENYCQRVGQIK